MEFKAFSFEQNTYSFATVKQKVADAVDNTTVYFESFSDSTALFHYSHRKKTPDAKMHPVQKRA